ncbi:hypothetical protein FT663_00177 [Candidozyma haemuli var. vulneris]|uniref:Hcy-binding domain-containing protein n=1 Tax=Candidozyma haemuli TaxID=45357 RepID=A0A2V1ANE5_9ASCO|nr:hypothetical protein CXQ85_001029 [[Candida] haemuloni]KAF3994207.1 hypothetical protein FT662_00076 [[Candida] haemuloni var. vulneris]KAF3995755.1 hypothetical protein FT663_00177 [[Candida] haemuloni var. vulneris]PVH18743.1 hypothetical protein CXQ85_001029 [[Candida] haemuloni]
MSIKSVLENRRLVLDGAMGTQLEEIIPPSSPMYVKGSPLWSTEVLLGDPSIIEKVHSSYLEKGADVIITSTYQASQATLLKHRNMGLEEAREVWRRSVQTAKAAIDNFGSTKKLYVAGSVGPYGAYLANGAEYSGEYGDFGVEELVKYHQEQVSFFLNDKDTDLIAFETIPNISEVKAIFELVKATYTEKSKDFYVCFSCKDSTTLADGTDLKDVIAYVIDQRSKFPAIDASLIGVGCNCVDFELVSDFADYVNKASNNSLFLAVYPNLGFSNDMSDVSQYGFKSDTEKWKQALEQWCTNSSIRLIGSCCSTGPNEIGVARAVVDESTGK